MYVLPTTFIFSSTSTCLITFLSCGYFSIMVMVKMDTVKNKTGEKMIVPLLLLFDNSICSFPTEVKHFMSAKFHFVDLAGSERAHRTGNVGDRFKGKLPIFIMSSTCIHVPTVLFN